MATPIFQVQNVSINVIAGAPGNVFVPTTAPDGTPIDVSAGYTIRNMNSVPSADVNEQASATSLTSSFTAAFSATGLTLSWTSAQATAINSLPKTNNSFFTINVTNDASTTHSLLAIGNLLLDFNHGLGA